MNATSRTLVFVGVAAFSAVAAMGVRFANRPVAVDGFSDVGQEFFADFKDPLKASELSVVKYDTETKEPISFAVKQNDKGLWVIPSHQDYPAEASERLARTAASLIGIKKVALQSRSKEDWGRYGVEDPSAEVTAAGAATAGATAAGDDAKDDVRGTRISLRDNSSNPLVDLIIGKPVEGREKHFYVRQPEKNPVFIAKLDADLSAKFSDWIEPDLLKLTQADIVKIVADRYTIDEEQGAVLKGEILEFSKDKTSNKWTMPGLDAATEQVKESAITDVTRDLDNLKIVGVRPKPEGISSDLKVSREVARNPLMMQALQLDMQRQGFYVAPDESGERKLYSNEGELIAGTNNGVKYTLYFGEIARGTAKDIETGLNEPKASADGAKTEGAEAKPEEPKAEDTPPGPESGPRRYLLVKVEYDETLLGEKPVEPVAPEKPAILTEGAATPAAPAAEEKKPEAAAAPEAAETPADAPKPDAPAGDAAKEAPPEVKPAEPAAEEKPADAAPSCDEPAAAEPAAAEPVQEAAPATPAVATEATAQEPVAPATTEPAATEPAATATQEGQPATGDTSATPAPATTPAGDEKPAAPIAPPVDPKVEAQKQYDQAMGEFEAAKAGHQGAVKAWEQRATDGKKKVDELSTRFGAWYYVISADSFEKFKLARATVVEPKSAAAPAGPGVGGPPGAGLVPQFDVPGLGR